MSVGYQRLVDPDDLLSRLREFAPRTIVFDVEPFVARWDTGYATLVDGVWRIIELVASNAVGVQVVAFATNSRRRLPLPDDRGSLRLVYIAGAAKPFRSAMYRHLPRPGVVVGDQVATDGVLAWRLGYGFLHVRPSPPISVPLGPRVMNALGRPLRPFLFDRIE
jgi:predicted HAD superfamily phosphohydrolase YqeG